MEVARVTNRMQADVIADVLTMEQVADSGVAT